jgi:catechol 2,3-dioxygenase-like lactoylglutathione lyase family enzyme
MTLNHIHLGTKNLKTSTLFYESLFGFRKKHDHGDGVFLDNEAGFLLAIDPVEEVPTLPTWFHLGFGLKTEQQALQMYERALELKVRIAREMKYLKGQYASFHVYDPDGYRIEISWHNE